MKELRKGFFVVFRFCGPLQGSIEKTRVFDDFERIDQRLESPHPAHWMKTER